MKKLQYLVLMTLLVIGCGKDNPTGEIPNEPEQKLSSQKILGDFTLFDEATGKWRNTEIKDNVVTAVIETPFDIKALVATVRIPDKATISPDPTQKRDYTTPVVYTITAEDGTKAEYKVIVTKRLLSESNIYRLHFKEVGKSRDHYNPHPSLNQHDKNADIRIVVPLTTDVTKLTSVFEISEGATIHPKAGQTLDYTKPVEYTVTSEDGKTVLKYTVTVIFDDLPKLSLSINGEEFRNVPPGGTIVFGVNVLPKHEDIRVSLVTENGKSSVPLTIQKVDDTNKKIHVKLPDTYLNGIYKLDVRIAENNSAMSYTFVLHGGNPVFHYITSNGGGPKTPNSLLYLAEQFGIFASINRKDFAKHSFFIKKNGEYLPLENARFHTNSTTIILEAPLELTNTSLETGTDFEFVIRYEGKEYTYPLVNNKKEPVKVYIPKPPVVTGVSKTSVTQGETLVIKGSNLFYPHGDLRDGGRDKINHYTAIRSRTPSKEWISMIGKEMDAQGNLVLTVPFNFLAETEYKLFIDSNVDSFGSLETPITIKVELPKPTHPTMRIQEAEVYHENSKYFKKQLRVKFNGDISKINIKAIVFPEYQNAKITNFIVYEGSNSIMTGELNFWEYRDVYTRRHTLYVLFEEGGKEYKLYFNAKRGEQND